MREPAPRGAVVTVGSFDGVHLGHQAVLEEIARRAEAGNRQSLLVTFEPHPLEVVNPQAAPPLLTTGPERREALAQTPLDLAYFLRFDRQVAGMSPDESHRLINLIELVRQRGVSVLLVEHHMKVVMGVCDRIVVLDHGVKIAEGTPNDVANNPLVIKVYLGRETARA